MTGTGIAEIVMIMMILRSGVSMIVKKSQDVLHTALKNGDGIAETLAHEIEKKFINRPYIIPLSDDVRGHWNGMNRSLILRTTTINMALYYNRENVAIIIIDKGANLLLTDQYGNTPLHIAAFRGLNIAVIKILDKINMLKPQVIDIKNSVGDTPLHMAVRYNRNLIVKSLLDNGADPMIADRYGNTPLHLAVKNNLSEEIILYIIDAARRKTVDILNENGMTDPSVGLSGRIIHNDLFSVNRIPLAHHEATSDIINLRNDFGRTALFQAVFEESFHIVRILLDRGADPSIAENNGNTPFHINMPSALTDEIILSCIQHMNVNHRNSNGATLLHTAIQCEREVLVKDLLDRGANPIIADHRGLTALHLATLHGLSQQIIIHIIHAWRPNPSDLRFQSGMTEHFYSSLLHRLIRGLNSNLALEVFKLSCDGIINLRAHDGRTALFFAAALSAEIAQILLENGADPTITDSDHLGPFHDTSMTNENFVSMIQNVDVNHRYIDGSTILHLAINLSREVVVKYLLDKGANPTIADNSGNTALHRAIHSNINKQTLVHILDAAPPKATDNLGQNRMTQISGCLNGEVNHDDRQIGDYEMINVRNHKGQTALCLAFCFRRCHRISQLLLERGADPHLADNDGNTPLHFDMPRFLTDEFIISTIKTRDINHRNSYGTYLHLAVTFKREVVVKYLLDKGANPTIADDSGNTALHRAIHSNVNEQILVHILDAERPKAADNLGHNKMTHISGCLNGEVNHDDRQIGACEIINLRNHMGQTALLLAFRFSSDNIAQVLIKRGADPNLADNDGNTPLHFNMPGTDELIISTLKNLNINYRHSEGSTYLHQAARCNRENVIKYLLDRGANPMALDYNENTVLHSAVEHNLSEQIVIDIIESKDLGQLLPDNKKRWFGFFDGFLSLFSLKPQNTFCETWDKQLLNMQNKCDKTALHLAVSQQRVDLVRVFLKKGASFTIKANGETALELAIEKKKANSTPFAATIVELFKAKF